MRELYDNLVVLNEDYKNFTGWIYPDGYVEDFTSSGHVGIATDYFRKTSDEYRGIDPLVAFWLYTALFDLVRIQVFEDALETVMSFNICNSLTSSQLKVLREYSQNVDDVHYELAKVDVSNIDGLMKLEDESSLIFAKGSSWQEFMGNIRKYKMVKPVTESTIDFPQKSLDPAIWDESNGVYSLKPEVKDHIYSTLALYKPVDLMDLAKAIHITGSIGTNTYQSDADIDIHIIPKEGIEDSIGDMNAFQKEVFKWYKASRDDLNIYIGEHPVEVYIQLDEEQELLSDAVYNITTDDWIKGPTIHPADYDPYEEFGNILDDVKAEAKNADLLFGELKRDVIDYGVIKKAVSGMSKEEKNNLLTRSQEKLKEIEDDISKLMSTKQGWIDMRKAASTPTSPQQALDDIELAKKWKDKNALFKFLDRYNYMRLIKDLEAMMEDDSINPEEVEIIQGLLGGY